MISGELVQLETTIPARRVHVLGDMRRVQLGEDLYFLLDILNLIFRTLQIDDLNGDSPLGSLVVT